jgi:hypothetical protein
MWQVVETIADAAPAGAKAGGRAANQRDKGHNTDLEAGGVALA